MKKIEKGEKENLVCTNLKQCPQNAMWHYVVYRKKDLKKRTKSSLYFSIFYLSIVLELP